MFFPLFPTPPARQSPWSQAKGWRFFGGKNADLLNKGYDMGNPKQKDHLSPPRQGKGNFWFSISEPAKSTPFYRDLIQQRQEMLYINIVYNMYIYKTTFHQNLVLFNLKTASSHPKPTFLLGGSLLQKRAHPLGTARKGWEGSWPPGSASAGGNLSPTRDTQGTPKATNALEGSGTP